MKPQLAYTQAIIYRGYDIYKTVNGWKVYKDGIIDGAQDNEEACFAYIDRQHRLAK
jgi:hypothetical protein